MKTSTIEGEKLIAFGARAKLCTSCDSEWYSDSARWCTKCGARLNSPIGAVAQWFRVLLGAFDPERERFVAPQTDDPDPQALRRRFHALFLSSLSRPVIATLLPSRASVVPPRASVEQSVLVVNRGEIITRACDACGRGLANNKRGGKLLQACLNDTGGPYFFCAACGDNILSHARSEGAKKRYDWDWAIPVKPLPPSEAAD